MTATRCAVIGVGYLGRFHAQKYKALQGRGLCQLVAVCDSSAKRAEEIGKEIAVTFESDYRNLKGKVDAVSIAADTSVHFEVAKFFLENGIHVLVEKPVAAESREGQILTELAKERELTLQVGHIERFSPAWTKAAEYIDKPLLADFQRLAPFGPRSNSRVDVVVDLMVHDLDLLLSLDSSPVKVVSASTQSLVTSVSDVAMAHLKFESGFEAHVTASRVAPFVFRRAHVIQKTGSVQIDMGQLTVNVALYKSPLPEIINLQVEKADALELEVESFLRAVKENRPPLVTGLAGTRALRLAEQILETTSEK